MSQQEKFNAKVAALGDNILTALRAELPEIVAAVIAKTPPGQPLDLTPLDALDAKIKAAIGGLSEEVAAPPAEGKHNVTVSTVTGGEESFNVLVDDKGCDDEQAARLRSIFDAGVAEAKAQAASGEPPGASFQTTASFTDNGETVTETFTTEAEKAAFDDATSAAINAVARAQRAAIRSGA